MFQFRDAALTAPDTWSLSIRLRGQRGTEAAMHAGLERRGDACYSGCRRASDHRAMHS